MSKSTFPVFFDQGGSKLHCFKIDGSEVTTSFATTGLDLRGRMLATIKDASNVQTVLFNQSMQDAYIFIEPLTDNGSALLALTTSGDRVTGFTLTGTKRDDNTTTLADQDFFVYVVEFTTNLVVT